jgi:hypothetical protein
MSHLLDWEDTLGVLHGFVGRFVSFSVGPADPIRRPATIAQFGGRLSFTREGEVVLKGEEGNQGEALYFALGEDNERAGFWLSEGTFTGAGWVETTPKAFRIYVGEFALLLSVKG